MSYDKRGPKIKYTNEKAHKVELAVEIMGREYNDDLYHLLKWAESLRQEVEDRYTEAQVHAIMSTLIRDSKFDLALIKTNLEAAGEWPDD